MFAAKKLGYTKVQRGVDILNTDSKRHIHVKLTCEALNNYDKDKNYKCFHRQDNQMLLYSVYPWVFKLSRFLFRN